MVTYKPLWKLLVDKGMSKADLRKASGISPNTMTKMRKDEDVALSVLCKICTTLNVFPKNPSRTSKVPFFVHLFVYYYFRSKVLWS